MKNNTLKSLKQKKNNFLRNTKRLNEKTTTTKKIKTKNINKKAQ